MKTILITGGAGYVGSHVSHALMEAGYACVGAGHGAAAALCKGYDGDITDPGFMDDVMAKVQPVAVIHLAAFGSPLESCLRPTFCYDHNVAATMHVLAAMVRHGVSQMIFASTAMVYAPHAPHMPYEEHAPLQPNNPYAKSKWIIENVLSDCAAAYGLRAVVMRHFNPAGAHGEARALGLNGGNAHALAVLTRVALGQLPVFDLYGTDYPTVDGTSVRDYVHVSDVAQAHVQALRYLEAGGENIVVNISTGQGTSLRGLLTAVERHCGAALPVRYLPRRDIHQPYLVGAADRAREVLQWKPEQSELSHMIASSFHWFSSAHS